MNSPEIKEFIYQHSNLFWYTPEDKKGDISHEYLVENIMNYGDFDDIKKLIQILGMDRLAEIYKNLDGRKKLNYYPEMYHYLSALIQRYARSNI